MACIWQHFHRANTILNFYCSFVFTHDVHYACCVALPLWCSTSCVVLLSTHNVLLHFMCGPTLYLYFMSTVGSSQSPVVIDLTLSSDEEEDEPSRPRWVYSPNLSRTSLVNMSTTYVETKFVEYDCDFLLCESVRQPRFSFSVVKLTNCSVAYLKLWYCCVVQMNWHFYALFSLVQSPAYLQ